MKERMDFFKVAPEAYTAMRGLEDYLKTTELSFFEKELIKTRASQINGCAYCLHMHTRDARKGGEKEERLYLLSAWRETNYYTPRERALLALTEAVTSIANNHVPQDVYDEAIKELGEKGVAEGIMAIVTINAWNRIAIARQTPPPTDF
jgi:AhpD family alkylhydroperoxidase